MITARIKRQLHAIDWDFSEHFPGTSKTLHWYPGTFPSELPATLIQALSTHDDLIFDPYGGIGTTGVEALRQGRRAWLVESNPVGWLVSYVSGCFLLLKAADEALPSILIDILRFTLSKSLETHNIPSRLDTDDEIPRRIDNILRKSAKPAPKKFNELFCKEPVWAMLEEWIEPTTIEDIHQILKCLSTTSLGDFGRLVGLVMISAILRPASSQTQSWGHIADNVRPKQFERKDVFRLCQHWLTRTETIVNKTDVTMMSKTDLGSVRFWASLHSWQKRSRPSLAPKLPVKTLITSPPYADAIDYSLAQRLSLYFLGYSEDDVRSFTNVEIGARRKRFLSTSHATWADELVGALSQQIDYCAENSLLAFVLPHKDAGREIGPRFIEEFLSSKALEKLLEVERSIRQIRARQSWTSIKKEIVQIYG